MADSPELDPERLDLSAFEVPPPPPGLADRVLARLPAAESPPPPRRSPWQALAAVAALLLVTLSGAAWWAFGPPESGERTFTQRETVRLGASSVAVAEPGAELHWTAGRRGTVRVRQPAGRVFYRVESGSDFQVETPAGQVAVRGTCFTVEVHPMLPSKQTLTGAAVGAALTAAVFVTVHEGRVAVTSPTGATQVQPGERAVMSAGAAPRVVAAPVAPGPTEASTALAPASPAGAPSTWQAREAAYVAELTTLRARVKELESSQGGARLPPGAKPANFLEPSREELLDMAKSCKLRWDEPGLGARHAPLPSAEELAELGMTQDEAEVIAEVYASFAAQSLEQLRAIYVAATGDVDSSRVLAPEALKQEILDKSPEDAIKRAYHHVSQERAGLATPPPDITGMTPAERLVRFNTGLGDAYERALADKLGASRAHQLRAKHNGWGSKHDSSVGCPAQ
jgi:hypothetical protein